MFCRATPGSTGTQACATKILRMSSVDALAEFNRAILQYILRRPGPPCRAFTYFWNGCAGNIYATEDILDRIICFV